MKKYRKTIPQIPVLLDDSLGSVPDIQQGIQRYAKLYGPWKLHYHIGVGEIREFLKQGKRKPCPTGLLARVLENDLAEAVLALKYPTVFIDPPSLLTQKKRLPHNVSRVSLDTAKVGKMVADDFLKRGIHHFGFVPTVPPNDWSTDHFLAFQAELARHGRELSLYAPPVSIRQELAKRHLGTWIQKLPKPVAIFTPSDYRGYEILGVCQDMKIAVPYEVLVLSVGNDEIVCESCFPSLSSVMLHWQRGGFAAAEMLDQLLRRTLKKRQHGTYDAFEIVSRDSTRQIVDPSGKTLGQHLTDNCVIRALEFIRINSGFCIQVEDVAKHVGVTRQWLEKRFRAELGHTVLDDIRFLRLEKIKSLLVETDLTVNRIAEMSGYIDTNHLRMIFKRAFKMSMTDYRKQHRPDSKNARRDEREGSG